MAEEQKEPTRKELAEALAKALSVIEEQGKAIAELRAKPQVMTAAPRPAPQAIPYKGYVRAREACYIGFLRGAGDIFAHETPCLWSDDPFEPVNVVGTRDDGQLVTEPWPEGKAPQPLPFHLRPRTHDALAAAAATPRRASEW